VTLNHATVTANSSVAHGGGIQENGGVFDVSNSIVSGNTSTIAVESNCNSGLNSFGFNLEQGTTCSFGQSTDQNADPKLGPLTNNGGRTNTHFPTGGSAAIDSASTPGCPAADQRGVTRPQGTGCDEGAVEAEFADVSIAISDSPDPVTAFDSLTYTIRVKNVGTRNAYSVQVSDTFPSSVRVQRASTTLGTCSGDGTQTRVCDLGGIPPGGDVVVTILVAPKLAGTLTNTPTVSLANPDTNVANNSAQAKTTVKAAKGRCANPITGTAADDTLTGSPGGDTLKGRSGDDTLAGKGGADCLRGEKGDDRLSGGDGPDDLSGGRGNDRMKGGKGKDVFTGGRGNDRISAADGTREKVSCGKGNDRAVVDQADSVKDCEVVVRV
jgi:uncharacterized repeat protein (TIGR01451 family)